jgi:hypothetical protein
VALDKLFADGKAHTGSFVIAGFSMKTLERGKNNLQNPSGQGG